MAHLPETEGDTMRGHRAGDETQGAVQGDAKEWTRRGRAGGVGLHDGLLHVFVSFSASPRQEGEQDRAGWRTGTWNRQGLPPPARPAH